MIGFVQKWLRRVFYISESADAFDTNSTIWIRENYHFAWGDSGARVFYCLSCPVRTE